MSVSNTQVGELYTCNGITTVFAIPFAWLEIAQIKVYKSNTLTGEIVELVLGSDYELSPDEVDPNSVVIAPALESEFEVIVTRVTDITQLTDYINNGAFPAEMHEQALDKLTMILQEKDDELRSAVILSAVDKLNGFDRQLPLAVERGIVRVKDGITGLEFKTIEEIMDEAGFTDQINQAVADSANALAAADAAAISAAAAQAAADSAAVDALAAADSAAAAVGASVSNRIQISLYSPAENGALVEEEYEQEVCKLGIGNRVTGFVKMSQYFILGRPIVLGFCSYSTTFDVTSLYKLLVTATLVKNGQEVSSVVNQMLMNDETTVTAVASALKVHSLEITPDGEINGIAVDPNDGIKLEIKRVDASVPANEDLALTRILKQTAELSFA